MRIMKSFKAIGQALLWKAFLGVAQLHALRFSIFRKFSCYDRTEVLHQDLSKA